jgi:hypothetical protein
MKRIVEFEAAALVLHSNAFDKKSRRGSAEKESRAEK